MLLVAALALFAILLLVAAANDIATMTIPNWVSVALAAAFPVFALAAGHSLAFVGYHLAIGFVVLLLGIGLFSLNLLGGGDVKVIAAAAVWTGLSGFAVFLSATLLVGGALAIGLVLVRRFAKPQEGRPAFLNRLLDPQRGAPYAVAIAAGGLMALPSLPFAERIVFALTPL
jgi:prepilin peptidase CpaA